MRISPFLVAALTWSCLGVVNAADWTTSVFPERSHDFGTVARGSKVRHSFPIVNTTDQIVHIKSWRTKCGCTDVRVGARDIPPKTKTVVEAMIDTTNYQGYKPSGLVLSLDQPVAVDIDLSLTCFIQAELNLRPGNVDFGIVNRLTAPQAELALTYSGTQPDWSISSAFTISEHVTAKLLEQARSAGGPVTYQLTVKLNPSVPVGFFKDEITLKTNDPKTPNIPISVAAVVQSNVTVTPTVMNLGPVKPGDSIQKTFIVRSSQPFKVISVDSTRPEIVATSAPDQSKPLHSLSFTFKAPSTPGAFNAVVEVQTDIKDEPVTKLTAFATVVP